MRWGIMRHHVPRGRLNSNTQVMSPLIRLHLRGGGGRAVFHVSRGKSIHLLDRDDSSKDECWTYDHKQHEKQQKSKKQYMYRTCLCTNSINSVVLVWTVTHTLNTYRSSILAQLHRLPHCLIMLINHVFIWQSSPWAPNDQGPVW